MKQLFKKRIILRKNLHLADLLYLIDTKGRYSLKFSFKSKLKPIRTWKKHYGGLKKLDFNHPHTEKIVEDGESLEISFKFADNRLEVKREVKKGSIDRSFYIVEMPISKSLFSVIIRNPERLRPIKSPNKDDIVINDPELRDQMALVFSFEGQEKKPFMDGIVDAEFGRELIIQLPEQELNLLHIAIVKDNNPIRYDSMIVIPHNPTKIT